MKISALLTAAALATTLVASATPTHAAPERAPKKPYVVKATASKAEVRQDGKVVLKGTVKPGRKGDQVVLEVRYGNGPWRRTKNTGQLDRRGAFRIIDTVSTTSSREYRVLAPGDATRRAGRSVALPVVVWAWRDLTSFSPVRRDATSSAGRLAINGTTYDTSLVATGGVAGAVEYNVSRKCRQLVTQVGLADHSATGATGTVTLDADGATRYTGTFGLAQSAEVVVPLTDVFRVGFDWTTPDETGSHPALGGPKVLCRD